jgi:hypothetical protein
VIESRRALARWRFFVVDTVVLNKKIEIAETTYYYLYIVDVRDGWATGADLGRQ